MARISNPLRAGIPAIVAAASVLGTLSVGLGSACNTQPVEYLTSDGQILVSRPTPIGGQTPMDILWVIDNSNSMCQEQGVLRDNFDRFISEIQQTQLDFHIAVTTTHAPDVGITDPVAQEAHIQSRPQPVPAGAGSCVQGTGEFRAEPGDPGVQTDFLPLREALEVAKGCLRENVDTTEFNWTEEQILCAVRRSTADSPCVQQTGLPNRNTDNESPETPIYDVFDLFPLPDQYREIPPVLRAEDYRDTDGNLDSEQLREDFACMSFVGTRGSTYEKGLEVAVKAVSPELTGGVVGATDADTTAPNHGFIRGDAGLSLIFVTDENDCSHDGTIDERGLCGEEVCYYQNSTELTAEESALISPEAFAQQLRENLAATKGIDVGDLNEDSLLMASINGTSRGNRFSKPVPDCSAAPPLEGTPDYEPYAVTAVCSSTTGEAFSGDRYERFNRQFTNYYPNSAPRDELENLGWMCADGSFAPALEAIGEFLGGISPSCIRDDVYVCETDADCPAKVFTGEEGTCREFPGRDGQRFCDSGLLLKLVRDETQQAETPDINNLSYCIPESIGELGPNTCVISAEQYEWVACSDSSAGIKYDWAEPDTTVSRKLSGYVLELNYALSILEEGSSSDDQMSMMTDTQ